jgi:hypothetical protein
VKGGCVRVVSEQESLVCIFQAGGEKKRKGKYSDTHDLHQSGIRGSTIGRSRFHNATQKREAVT